MGQGATVIPVRQFTKGENKEQIARPLIEAADARAATGGWC